VEASSGSPVAHINERMIADALIEAGLVTGSRHLVRKFSNVYGVQPSPNARKKAFAMYNAMHNSVVYDALAVPSDLSHVVESTCDPLTLTAAV